MTLPAESIAPQRARNRRLIIVIGVVIPLLITVVGAFVMALWIPELPNPVASHWGTNGPDGYSTVGGVIVLPLLITLVFTVLAAIVSWKGAPQGGLVWAHKILIATSVFLAALLTVIAAGSLAIQQGLESADAAGDVGGVMLAAFVVATLLALFGWLMLPAAEKVQIDHRGLRVRSAMGWPRATIAPNQIESVSAVAVDPIGEFGGYGWRWAPDGRSGIVLSKGEAIEVKRTNGKKFIVTMHDAKRGAEVLATVAKK